jgi:hypothetical protein
MIGANMAPARIGSDRETRLAISVSARVGKTT